MTEFWLGYHLRHFTTEKIDLKKAKSAYLPWFYKLGKDGILELKNANADENYAALKAGQLYERLRNKEEDEATSELIPQAWDRIGAYWMEASRKSFLWRVAHRVIPVRERFYAWKKASDGNCVACRRPETVEHAVFECMVIARVWESVKKYFGLNTLTYEEAMAHHTVKLNKRERKFFQLVAAETAYQGWVNRCRVSHGGDAWDEKTVKAKISFYVRLWLGRERVRLGEVAFKRIWQCKGFKIENGTVKFKLH